MPSYFRSFCSWGTVGVGSEIGTTKGPAMTAQTITQTPITEDLLRALTVKELRKYAKGNVKNFGTMSKDALMAALVQHYAPKVVEAPKAKKTAKRCEICKTRPVMSAASARARGTNFPYCDPCQDLAEWENMHSDYGHDATSETTVPQGGDEEAGKRVEGCWICFPELDQTSATYVAKSGTSRLGMTIHVKVRASGSEKAEQTAALMPYDSHTAWKSSKGIVTLHVEANGCDLTLRWDTQGHYLYAESSATVQGKTRKVRNVSEALRLVS